VSTPRIEADGSLVQGDVRVRLWPPSLEPECWKAKTLIAQALVALPGEPMYAGRLPDGLTEAGRHLGWKAPWVFAASLDRVQDLWLRNRALIVALARKSPDWVPPLKAFLNHALAGRDRDIAAAIGYPATPGFVKTLSKVDLEGLHPAALKQLLGIWATPWARKLLYHLPNVNQDVRNLLSRHPRDHVNFDMLWRASQSGVGQNDVGWALSMLEGEWDVARRIAAGGEPPGPATWPYGNLRYVDLHAAIHRIHLARFKGTPFPPPPIQGDMQIHPISTAASLCREGQKMRNCCGTMQDLVLEGRGYFYHLSRSRCPCTILILPRVDYWALAELRALENGPPSIQAVEEVLTWLREAYPMTDGLQFDQRRERMVTWDEETEEGPSDDEIF